MGTSFWRNVPAAIVFTVIVCCLSITGSRRAAADGLATGVSQTAADDTYRKAYQALSQAEIAKQKVDALPQATFKRIDVSPRMRSASFGHKTWVLVPPQRAQGGGEFYLEFGKSTNHPASYFGPFPLH